MEWRLDKRRAVSLGTYHNLAALRVAWIRRAIEHLTPSDQNMVQFLDTMVAHGKPREFADWREQAEQMLRTWTFPETSERFEYRWYRIPRSPASAALSLHGYLLDNDYIPSRRFIEERLDALAAVISSRPVARVVVAYLDELVLLQRMGLAGLYALVQDPIADAAGRYWLAPDELRDIQCTLQLLPSAPLPPGLPALLDVAIAQNARLEVCWK